MFDQSRLVFQLDGSLGYGQTSGVENDAKQLGFAGLGMAKRRSEQEGHDQEGDGKSRFEGHEVPLHVFQNIYVL